MDVKEFKKYESEQRKKWRQEHKENIIRSQARYWTKKLAELEAAGKKKKVKGV